MPNATHIDVQSGDIALLLGTSKGVFILRSDNARDNWDLGGPYFPGDEIYSMTLDTRNGRQRLFAGRANHYGAVLSHSDDFGRTWTTPEQSNVKFAEGAGDALKQIWEIVPGRKDESDVLRCGVNPAALFESRDAGESWQVVEGIYNHPHRKLWMPGGGGLCLHTIVTDPTDINRMFVAVSTGGVYRTTDGGKTWIPRNKGISAVFMPGEPPEFGQCVHRIVMDSKNPNRLYVQNHWGLFRSDDGADTWIDIGKDFPWTFGFAMAVHPHHPDTAYIVPLESDQYRCTPEGKLRVWRTKDAGASWHELTKGLPQDNALETVLRHGMSNDQLKPAGIYFGTESGKVYGSTDDGDSWRLIQQGLPPVLSVKVAML